MVPNQKERLEWRLAGRGWRQAAYAFDPAPAAGPAGVDRFKDQAEEPAAAEPILLSYTFPQVRTANAAPATQPTPPPPHSPRHSAPTKPTPTLPHGAHMAPTALAGEPGRCCPGG